MRKLYNEFFYIPKHERIREKVMIARVAVMAMIVVFCLAAMSITAYAYFSCNVTSGSNMIKTVTLEMQVKISDENGADVDIIPITSDYKTYELAGLEVGKYYTVTIAPTDNTTAETGFVVVSADGCDKSYHTQQLDIGGESPELSFKLMITDKTNVVLLAHWGTSSYFDDYINGDNEELYITQGEEIKMIVNDVIEPAIVIEDNEDSNGDSVDVPSDTTVTSSTD